jgi:hypothetical protein
MVVEGIGSHYLYWNTLFESSYLEKQLGTLKIVS